MDLDPDQTATFEADGSATEQTEALAFESPTLEASVFEEPFPLPPPLHGEPAYLVEVRPANRPPTLLAVRATLEDAQTLAATVHPAVADVTIRELPLPCDALSLARAAAMQRVWCRSADGEWSAG
jgi:hypothetical protein